MDKIKKRILITGASGFIGGYLVREALKMGYEVWAAVRKTSRVDDLKSLGVHLVEIDYTSILTVSRQANSLAPKEDEPAWHLVVHNAGITKTNRPELFEEVNANQTRHLAEGLANATISPDRFILISSLSSYGPSQEEGKPISIYDRQQPNTLYGKSKKKAEFYTENSTLSYTIMLLTGVYGPGDKDYLMALQSVNKGFDFVTGLTPQKLTFIYGEDVARAVMSVIEAPQAVNKRYMLTDGDVYTDTEFGRMMQRLLGKKRVIHARIPLPIVWLACQIGELVSKITGKITPLNRDKYSILKQRDWTCDDSLIKELGFVPKTCLEEGLKKTIEAARSEGLL
ncbi:NAD-dependent epimerase/dehydratase family protein [Falsiporphyromonas endometrii]|uniref:NAD-dependent epimerase/dehydratase family protein n=1 Tax=Falsiporphyromonas endometrii TaxID=1387297 RepID=A0ABV9K654_9PORP